MDESIMIVLGSPNSATGELGPIAISRLEVCQRLYEQNPQKIVLTGGFGPHFNISINPHAYYLKQALLGLGVPSEDILPLVESRHSVEDATLSKWIIEAYHLAKVTIITSDFHLARAKLIFDAVYAPFENFIFCAASSEHIDAALIDPLIRHEKLAVQDLLANGVRF